MTDVVGRLSDDAVAAVTASSSKAFETAVRRFTSDLEAVPDYPAADMTNEGFAHVNGLAEQVISDIERRLEADIPEPHRRELLAESVFAIRRALEEAFRWRRHYLRG
jgi:pantoate kinase